MHFNFLFKINKGLDALLEFLVEYFEKNKIFYHDTDEFGTAVSYCIGTEEKRLSFTERQVEKNVKVKTEDVAIEVECEKQDKTFSVKLSVTNIGNFDIDKVSFTLGIDSYMCTYPDWNEQFFPTLLRCEKTHFYGYFSTPSGRILALASPDEIVSWSHNYNEAVYGVERHSGHRIYNSSLDIVNSLPQPEHHPTACVLGRGQTKNATFYFRVLSNLNELDAFVSDVTGAPIIKIGKYTLEKCEKPFIECENNFVITDECNNIVNPDSFSDNCGRYFVTSKKEGKISQASVYVRKPWSWYLQKAALNAVAAPQKASTHMESWLGFFTRFYDLMYFPDNQKQEILLADFEKIFGMMYDFKNGEVYECACPERIQNISMTISLLTLAYCVVKDEKYLIYAEKLVDKLISSQTEDGAYRNGNTHYTCVSYLAKSMTEYYTVIKDNVKFKETAEKCRKSIIKAIKNLVECEDNIQTEGQMTFEDGMISCEVLQIALAALILPEEFGEEAVKTAEKLLGKHRCVEQQMISDCRQHGCTIRFWESMYDVIIHANFINSPHGWTAWKVYATYYLYLLTGKVEYLIDTMDTLGACVQCLDLNTEKLRWAFVADPCVETQIFVNENGGSLKKTVIGEKYIDMISGWWKSDKCVYGYAMPEIGNTEGIYRGASCDNDIHEVFKCLGETVLDKAFVHYENGKMICYNCFMNDNILTVYDSLIKELVVYSDDDLTIEYFDKKYVVNKTHTINRFSI